MKKQLAFFLVFSCAVLTVSAQQRIGDASTGSKLPNKDAILELESKNKALLVSRIALSSTTVATPLSVHTAGMIAYNTATINDVVPGIYYNDGTKWLLVGKGETTNIKYDPVTNIISYIDGSGNAVTIDIAGIVRGSQTVTKVVAEVLDGKNTGKYTYYNEKDIDKDGNITGPGTVINVVGDVQNNFQEIVNNTEVKQIFETIVKNTGGNVSYNATTNSFTYVDGTGTTQTINITDMVKGNETVTKLVAEVLDGKNTGKYTYYNEKDIDKDGNITGPGTVINVVGDVQNNFQEIVNNTEVKQIFETIVKNTGGNVSYNATTNSFTYVDGTGTTQTINITDMVKGNETVTKLVAEVLDGKNTGKYTYYNEKDIDKDGNITGPGTVINVVGDVQNNFQDIVNNTEVKNIFETIVKNTGGNVSYNATTNSFTYVDGTGTTQTINITDMVKGNETVTKLVAEVLDGKNTGKYTYYNEKDIDKDGNITGPGTVINVVGDVQNNFQEIVNNTEVKQIFETIVKNTGGNVSYNATTNSFTYVDGTGTTQTINITDMVKGNETVTKLVAEVLDGKNTGKYTYYNEKDIDKDGNITGPGTVINVVGDVQNNFQEIVNNTEVKQIFETIVKNTGGNVSYNATTNSFTYVDGTGTTQTINITDMVKGNETVTKLVAEMLDGKNTGKYTYYNEKDIDKDGNITGPGTVINVVGDVQNNFQEIVNNTEVKNIFETIVKNTGGNVSYNATTNSFTYVDGTGTTQTINITDMVKGNETVTKVVAEVVNGKNTGKYTYYNEKDIDKDGNITGPGTVINVVGDVQNNFQDIVNNTEVKNIFETIVKNTSGNVSYNATTNSFTYVDGNGVTQTINITDMVKNNETLTTLAYDNATKILTYKDEKGLNTSINISTLVTGNETLTVLSYDNATNTLTYKDEAGTTNTINIGQLVKNNETLTTLAYDNATKILTYKDEKGLNTSINISTLVTGNETLTVLSYDNATNTLTYKDEAGTTNTINIGSLVKNNETLTTLAYDNATKILTYKDEKGLNTSIDISTLVSGNETLTVLSYDNATNTLTYKDEAGTTNTINIGSLVKNNETLTTLAYDNATKILTYKDEKGLNTSIDISTLVSGNETLTVLSYDNATNTLTYKDEAGTTNTINLTNLVQNNQKNTSVSSGTYTTVAATTPTTNNTDYKVDVNPSTLAGPGLKVNAGKLEVDIATIPNASDKTATVATGTNTTVTTDATNPNNPIYKVNVATASGTTLGVVKEAATTPTVNIASDGTLSVNTIQLQANQKTSSVVSGTTTTVSSAITGNNTAYTVEINPSSVQNSQKLTTLSNGNITTVAATTSGNTTDYKVNVSTASTTLGVVKQATTAPTVDIASDGTLSVNTTQLQANQKTSSVTGTGLANVTSSTTGNNTNYTVDVTATAVQGAQKTSSVVGTTTASVSSTASGNNTAYTVSVPTASTTLGVVKQAASNATVNIAADGTLSVNTTATGLGKTLTGSGITVTAGAVAGTTTNVANSVLADVTLGIADKAVTVAKMADAPAPNQILVSSAGGAPTWTDQTTVAQNALKFKNGTNTTLNGNGTIATPYQYDVAAANGTTLGLVKQAASSPTVNIAADGTLSVNTTATGLGKTITTDGIIKVNTANSLANSVLADAAFSIADASITDTKIAPNAVTTAKIADGAVTVGKLSAGAGTVGRVGIANASGAVTYGILPASSVTGNNLTPGDGSIIIGGTGAGAGATLVNATVSVATDGITDTKIANGAVTTAKIADGSVISSKISDNTIVNADISSTAAINVVKLAAGNANQILMSVGSPAAAIWTNQTALTPNVSNSSSGNSLTTTVGATTGTAVNIINNNTLSLDGSSQLVSSVNGQASTLDLKTIEPWKVQGGTIGATSNTQNIYQNGKVAIGTTTVPAGADANATLYVAGTITTANSLYADYVFEDYFEGGSKLNNDYTFKSLKEIEEFIYRNKHLPGVTGIKGLAKNEKGEYVFNISKLSVQLLEKVEELYLHTIEQQKQLDAKDKEIQDLKAQQQKAEERLKRLEEAVLGKANK